ncbi:solute carrier family 28 member 3-like isoform X2 [Haliotis rubra]|uniref:solute carrier family 28 member 3-like isoform X2 n=1 Tax=Haliotis rubra TaxID=36100 RepID=UPI001EE50CED|nr:solute carrier family 28 member 3-like isoform X2 [Haliotis rubra]
MAEQHRVETIALVKRECPEKELFPERTCPKAEHEYNKEDVDLFISNTPDEGFDYREHYLQCGAAFGWARASLCKTIIRNKSMLVAICSLIALTAYAVYVGFSIRFSFGDEGSLRLLLGTGFVALIYAKVKLTTRVHELLSPWSNKISNSPSITRTIRWLLYIGMVLFMAIYLGLNVTKAENFLSLAGLTFFILLGFLISEHPERVNWHAVFWGIGTQFLFALMILRTSFGFRCFRWLGERLDEFLEHTNKGSEFVFGKTYQDHAFAFQVMPFILMCSSTINVLYYYGILQGFVANFGWLLSVCLGTSPVESVNTAINVVFGPAESPLAIKPFLPHLTPSELHAVMAAGFASIAGTVFGMLTSFGAPANHLLAASVMSAPAALAMSKLIAPETQPTRIQAHDAYNIPVPKFNNLLEAVSEGAKDAIPIVASVVVNQIIYIAIINFVDSTLLWFGGRVGVAGLSFEFLCSYGFYPIVYVMGFSSTDFLKIGELFGIKTFANSFYGYQLFGKLIKNRHAFEHYVASTNGTWHWENRDIVLDLTNRTLPGGILTKRSEVIGTYAFCGQNHLAAIGVTLGVFCTLIPARKGTITKYIARANVSGQLACYMTACIAGMLYDESFV